jgi:hypothetical protein
MNSPCNAIKVRADANVIGPSDIADMFDMI